MRRLLHNSTGYGPTVSMTASARVRASAWYLASRWIQAPIFDRREADT